jgi:hypothetical protein
MTASGSLVETLVFRDRSSLTVSVEHVGKKRYRISGPEIALSCQPLGYGDIIKAVRNPEGHLVVKRRVKKGDYRSLDYCLPVGWAERESVCCILEKIVELGGDWEGVMEGILLVCLPSECAYDPSNDLAEAFR